MFKHDLGVQARDVISGFKGVITGRLEYLTGCSQYLVCPQKLAKDGTVQTGVWFDEDCLIKTGKGIEA